MRLSCQIEGATPETKTKNQNEKMNITTTQDTKIKAGQILATRSTCNHECIYTMRIISRTPKTAQIEYDGKVRKAKIYEWQGVEQICPERYSMAPIFSADRQLAA